MKCIKKITREKIKNQTLSNITSYIFYLYDAKIKELGEEKKKEKAKRERDHKQ